MSRQIYSNGTLREEWDDTTRTYTAWDAQGGQVTQRDYTPEEDAAADLREAERAEVANRSSIEAAVDSALTSLGQIITDMGTLAGTTNATINQNPAVYIKQLGQRVEAIARLQRKTIRYVFNRLDGSD